MVFRSSPAEDFLHKPPGPLVQNPAERPRFRSSGVWLDGNRITTCPGFSVMGCRGFFMPGWTGVDMPPSASCPPNFQPLATPSPLTKNFALSLGSEPYPRMQRRSFGANSTIRESGPSRIKREQINTPRSKLKMGNDQQQPKASPQKPA